MQETERRATVRYVVEGLAAVVDGTPVEILDLGPTAIRIWWSGTEPPPPVATLVLANEPGRPPLAAKLRAELVRAAGGEVVYAYVPPSATWSDLLPAFDTFADLRVPMLEG